MNIDTVDHAGPPEEILRAQQIHEHHVAVEKSHPGIENRADDEIARCARSVPARSHDRRDDANRIAAFHLELLRQRHTDRDRALRRLSPGAAGLEAFSKSASEPSAM